MTSEDSGIPREPRVETTPSACQHWRREGNDRIGPAPDGNRLAGAGSDVKSADIIQWKQGQLAIWRMKVADERTAIDDQKYSDYRRFSGALSPRDSGPATSPSVRYWPCQRLSPSRCHMPNCLWFRFVVSTPPPESADTSQIPKEMYLYPAFSSFSTAPCLRTHKEHGSKCSPGAGSCGFRPHYCWPDPARA